MNVLGTLTLAFNPGRNKPVVLVPACILLFLGIWIEKGIALALKSFQGRLKIEDLHSDNFPAITVAAKKLDINYDLSQLDCPQSNSVIENLVRIFIVGTRVALETAGLPSCLLLYK